MTVTEVAPEANPSETPTPPRAWGQGSCHYHRTFYQAGNVVQQLLPCKCLDCERCGPKKRQADYEIAVGQFAAEEAVYMLTVPSFRVDHLRKQALRRGHPMKSVPIGPETNVVFSTHRFDGAEPIIDDDVRRVFITLRISKRHVTSVGKWERKTPAQPTNPPPAAIPITKEFVGEEAFRNVAKTLGKSVLSQRDVILFRDDDEKGPEFYKKLLIAEEARLRKERRRERGWSFWGGHWFRVNPRN